MLSFPLSRAVIPALVLQSEYCTLPFDIRNALFDIRAARISID